MRSRLSRSEYWLIIMGLMIALLIVTIVFGSPTLQIVALSAIGLVLATGGLVAAVNYRERPTIYEKSKHSDVYTRIDRLVSELDTEELAYLRRRLDETEGIHNGDPAASLEELLDQRQGERLAQRRD